MIFVEMSRGEAHGDGKWAFGSALFSPSRKLGGNGQPRGRWPYWENLLAVRAEDVILHLKLDGPHSAFVGCSIAASDGYRTRESPSNPNKIKHPGLLYRVDLKEYRPFPSKILLSDLFQRHDQFLREYFQRKSKPKDLFYVVQSNRLQCLNGAYLSCMDDELFQLLFGDFLEATGQQAAPTKVETGEVLRQGKARSGQAAFARKIKEIYGCRCCFPGCEIDDERFLVAAHIARWADSPQMRGELGNGLCLCVLHDKAFELGEFTLDQNLRVFVRADTRTKEGAVASQLSGRHGSQIRTALMGVVPNDVALHAHWERVGLDPLEPQPPHA